MEKERPPARLLRFSDVEVLRDRWDEGKASGRAGPLNIKRIIAEERALLGGGTKQRQQVDIERAKSKTLWAKYRARKAAAAKPKGKR